MREYRFEHLANAPAGRVVFRVRNIGKSEHLLKLLPLAEDVRPIMEQLRGSQRLAVAPFAGVHVKAPGAVGMFAVDLVEGRRYALIPPGAKGVFAVDLVAGRRYALICSLREADGTSHSREGMALEFRAASRSSEDS